jgi:hypothetical protein
MSEIDFNEEIRSAKEEMKSWLPERIKSCRLEGVDVYLERTKRYLAEMGVKKPR